jgi:hypothetical protein
MTIDRPQSKTATRFEQVVGRIDDDYFSLVSNLGLQVLHPGQLVTFDRKQGAALYLSAGSYGGGELGGSRQVIICAPGVTFTKQITITGSVEIQNGTFVCAENTPAIVVASGGSLLLSNSSISKGDLIHTAATDRYITVETGGYGSFNGCRFFGNQATVGTIITNEDALNPARAAAVGCVNYTGIVAATRYTNVGYSQDVAAA